MFKLVLEKAEEPEIKLLKHLPPIWETRVRSLAQEDPLEKEMVTHASILAWRIPRTEVINE